MTESDEFLSSIFPAERRSVLVGLREAEDMPALYAGDFTAFEGKTAEQKLQELIDREEIRELVACHAHRIARGFAVADLFTGDGILVIRVPGEPVTEFLGCEAIERLDEGVRHGEPTARPMIHNQQILIEGDVATGLCSQEIRIVIAGQSIVASGCFADRLRREQGRWRFALRELTFFDPVPFEYGRG